MKIAIIGATGRQGNLLAKEAISKGHKVTAIIRSSGNDNLNRTDVKVIKKDLLELEYLDIEENDVIIDAFGTWTPETCELHQTTLKFLSDMLSGKPNRLLVVGGAGSLYIDPEHTLKVFEKPDFPASIRPLAESQSKAFDDIKTRADVKWTYLCPAENFVADDIRTGLYKIGGDEIILNSVGVSQVSYADYAIAMIDEAENGKYICARFTVVSG